MTYLDKLKAVDSHRRESRYAERICSELTYLDNLSMLRGGELDSRIEEAADALLYRIESDGVITAGAVSDVEAMLSDLAPVAKSLKELFKAVGTGLVSCYVMALPFCKTPFDVNDVNKEKK